MWANPQFYVDMLAFNEWILNGEVHILCIVNRQKITAEKKIICFLKYYVASLFTFFETFFANILPLGV